LVIAQKEILILTIQKRDWHSEIRDYSLKARFKWFIPQMVTVEKYNTEIFEFRKNHLRIQNIV